MITQDKIVKIAKLARLKLEDHEFDHFAHQINQIVDMIDSLRDVSCDDTEPLRSVNDITPHVREDISLNDQNNIKDIFKNAPNKHTDNQDHYFVVPKVVE